MNDVSILRRRQVEVLTGRSYSSIRRDMARGHFPQAVQTGPRSVGWRSDEIRAWIDSRVVSHPAALAPRLGKKAA